MLLAFILSFSYVMSFICSFVVKSIEGPVVPLAVGGTLAATFLLTLYAFLCDGIFLIWVGILLILVPAIIAIVLCIWVFYF
jgi:hypothetical protein